jgi:hypothetical protein
MLLILPSSNAAPFALIAFTLLFALQRQLPAEIRVIAVDTEGARLAFRIDDVKCTTVNFRETTLAYRGSYGLEHRFGKDPSTIQCTVFGWTQTPRVRFSGVIGIKSPDELGIITIDIRQDHVLPRFPNRTVAIPKEYCNDARPGYVWLMIQRTDGALESRAQLGPNCEASLGSFLNGRYRVFVFSDFTVLAVGEIEHHRNEPTSVRLFKVLRESPIDRKH